MFTYAIKRDNKWDLANEEYVDGNACEKRASRLWMMKEIEDYLILWFNDDGQYRDLYEKVQALNSEDDEMNSDDAFWALLLFKG